MRSLPSTQFQHHRDDQLLALAQDAAFAGQEQVLGELLRDRRAADHLGRDHARLAVRALAHARLLRLSTRVPGPSRSCSTPSRPRPIRRRDARRSRRPRWRSPRGAGCRRFGLPPSLCCDHGSWCLSTTMRQISLRWNDVDSGATTTISATRSRKNSCSASTRDRQHADQPARAAQRRAHAAAPLAASSAAFSVAAIAASTSRRSSVSTWNVLGRTPIPQEERLGRLLHQHAQPVARDRALRASPAAGRAGWRRRTSCRARAHRA